MRNLLIGLAIVCLVVPMLIKMESDRREKQSGLSAYKRVVSKRDRPRVLEFGADW